MSNPQYYIIGNGSKRAPAVHVDPDAATRKQQAIRNTCAAISNYQRSVLSDELYHAEVVARGMTKHREVFLRGFKGHIVSRDIADNMFLNFALQWRRMHPEYTPEYFLDNVEIDEGPTQQEITDAWEWESFSSEECMRKYYSHSGRRKTGADVGRYIS